MGETGGEDMENLPAKILHGGVGEALVASGAAEGG
jgi:hypothetical protein